jgi:hypothetical protein
LSQRKLLVVDASVLIDYATTELQVLALTSRHVGTVHVARALLREVRAITEAKSKRLGLVLASGKPGPSDLAARSASWSCGCYRGPTS